MQVIRPSRTRRVLCSLPLGVLAAVLLAGGLQSEGLVRLLGIAGALAVAVFVWLASRLRVVVEPQGVVIVNLLSSHSVPWPDIERFTFNHGVVLRRKNQREIRVSAFAVSVDAISGAEGFARDAARQLDDLRRERQARIRRAERRGR